MPKGLKDLWRRRRTIWRILRAAARGSSIAYRLRVADGVIELNGDGIVAEQNIVHSTRVHGLRATGRGAWFVQNTIINCVFDAEDGAQEVDEAAGMGKG